MALRNQPYIPLYVQDVLTDEKLVECSAESHGIYFRLLCILHKQEKYGLLCLKQKYKQTSDKLENFALMLSKQMPFEQKQIAKGLGELFTEGVISITEDELSQKRMIHDGELSIMRSQIGKTGGSSVTKQYGKSGFLYLMSDTYTFHKIGISVNPQNRLYRLRSDLKLPKNFDIIEQVNVIDMGKSEDIAHSHFKEFMDGEWIKDDYNNILKNFDSLKAKLEAKPEANTEDESEDVIECLSNKEIEVLFEKFWVAYPKKEGKKPARQKFDSIFKNLTPEKSTKLLETMLNAIEIQKQTDKWKKDKGQFIPMPSTWLNQERWNDETIINVGNKNGKQLTNKFDGISTKLEDL